MSFSKHLLIHAAPSWGHNKPAAALVVMLTRARPELTVTILTTGLMYSKFIHELQSKLTVGEFDALMTRVYVIDIAGSKFHPLAPLSAFKPAYTALYEGQSITCISSGKVFEFSSLPRVSLAIIDHFAGYAFDDIRSVSQKQVPIVAFLTSPAGGTIRHFGPKRFGGIAPAEMETEEGRQKAKAKLNEMMSAMASVPFNLEAALKNKQPLPDTQKGVTTHNSNEFEVLKIPGAPPMYTHETRPQAKLPITKVVETLCQIYTVEGDAVIIASNSTFDGDMMGTLKNWLGGFDQPVYPIGPLTLPTPKGKEDKSNDVEVVEFLDKMRLRSGKRSLIYISFGTFFVPSEIEKVWAVIEALITSETPFIFAHASPLLSVTEEKKAWINNSGVGLELSWSPQQVILEHEVTGWFLTHGGWNSIMEAFESKIPLIIWPINGDQPLNAANLTLIHKAAFELIEVRGGEDGTKPLLRFKDTEYTPSFTIEGVKEEFIGVLEKIKGEEGQVVRKNFEKLSEEMGKSWHDGGESNSNFNDFLAKFVDCI